MQWTIDRHQDERGDGVGNRQEEEEELTVETSGNLEGYTLHKVRFLIRRGDAREDRAFEMRREVLSSLEMCNFFHGNLTQNTGRGE